MNVSPGYLCLQHCIISFKVLSMLKYRTGLEKWKDLLIDVSEYTYSGITSSIQLPHINLYRGELCTFHLGLDVVSLF